MNIQQIKQSVADLRQKNIADIMAKRPIANEQVEAACYINTYYFGGPLIFINFDQAMPVATNHRLLIGSLDRSRYILVRVQEYRYDEVRVLANRRSILFPWMYYAKLQTGDMKRGMRYWKRQGSPYDFSIVIDVIRQHQQNLATGSQPDVTQAIH